MRPLTEQQAMVVLYAANGYPFRMVGRAIGKPPGQAADQLGLAQKKGYRVSAPNATQARRAGR